MAEYSVLVDLSKCVGCGACTVACKLWNSLEFEGNDNGHDVQLDDNSWTVVQYHEVQKDGSEQLRFIKRQCHHCEDPVCATVCFAKAIKKTDEGPVVYDPTLCVGCRYCMIACPFEVPKYEWNKIFPSIMKCKMCPSRLAEGQATACSSVCPTGCLSFGTREEMLAEAHQRLESDSKYVQQVYGEEEAGGTSWFYISDVPFADMGLPANVPSKPLPHYVHNYTRFTPAVFLGGGALFVGLSLYTKRRRRIAEEKAAEKAKSAKKKEG